MRPLAAALFALAPVVAHAVDEAALQRALVERDRQSAEFANPALRNANARRDAQHLPPRPDERDLQRRERDAEALGATPPAATPAPDYRPLPLPGGPRHVVDPIPVQGVAG